MEAGSGVGGDAGRSLDAIVEENWGYVESVCRKRLMGGRSADVDDAIQDTFVEFLLADRERIIDTRGWLLTVAARMCGHIHRRRYRRAEVPIDTCRVDDSCDPSDAIVDGLAFTRLIADLSAVERQLITWRYVGQLSYEEAGRRLGLREGHARILVFRARRRIYDALIQGQFYDDDRRFSV